MTEGTAYGDMDHAPVLRRANDDRARKATGPCGRTSPHIAHLWQTEKFCGNVAGSMWESATLTCRPSPWWKS
jgi:oleate hydratase